MSKRVLIISYYWPPTGGSGVQRWVKFAKYLPSQGWEPVIFTPKNPEQLAVDESLLHDIPSGIEVIRRPIVEPYAIYRKFNRGVVGQARNEKKYRHAELVSAPLSAKGTQVNPLNGQKKTFRQKLAVWIRGNFFIPDPRIWWVKPSVKFLEKYLKEHPVDALVTTGPPHSMHLIGLGLKRRMPSLRWIADFRDPWTRMFYFKHMGLWPLARRKHYRLEQEVLDGADAIISVSPPVRDDFAAATSTPVHLVTNGFDLNDFAQIKPRPRNGRFTVVHTGLFASDGNPLNLWDALARKCRQDRQFASSLEIRLAGKTDPEIVESIRERGLGDNLTDLGYLPHDLVNVEQKSATVLILPLRREPEYSKVLPGKIFEYLAARRPVLGIGQEDGAAARVLRDAQAGIMCDWTASSTISNFIDNQWDKFLNGEDSAISSNIEKYNRVALTAQLCEIL